MQILIIGEEKRRNELRSGLSGNHTYIEHELVGKLEHGLQEFDVIFDLSFDNQIENCLYYKNLENTPVVLSAVKISLAEIIHDHGKWKSPVIGINALPGFLEKEKFEISLAGKEDSNMARELFSNLGKEVLIVGDRVGMVTPRIILMIINEACFTVQEGTASMADIDTGMKLGTNYPFGPFEWADMIGVKEVYLTLEALYADTGDERYKICPLLKRKYLKNEKLLSDNQ